MEILRRRNGDIKWLQFRLLTLIPSPKFASELCGPVHTNLDTLSTFYFFVGLFEVASVHLEYETFCQEARLSPPGFFEIWECKMATDWEQDPY